MIKHYIGIDVRQGETRIAVAVAEKGEVRPVFARRFAGSDPDLQALLREALQGEPALGDRAAGALPACCGYSRLLLLPFADSRKVEAVVANELGSRLPAAGGEMITDFQTPLPQGEEFAVRAAAVDSQLLQDLLAPLDAAGVPLYHLDMSPFAYASVLPERFRTGLLAVLDEDETVVALLEAGRVSDYRLLPKTPEQTDNDRADFVSRQSLLLEKATGRSDLRACLIGAGAGPNLVERLREGGRESELPRLLVQRQQVEPALVPAVLLALRAGRSDREAGFNFRRGPFQRKSQWAAARTRLTWTAALLALLLLCVATSSYLHYAGRVRSVDTLRGEIASVFSRTFPGRKAIRHQEAQQMKNAYMELQQRAKLLGLDRSGGALALLNEISGRVDPKLDFRVSELSYSQEGVRLKGQAPSFDTVNRLARGLEGSSLLGEVEIADAKMSLDGSRVDFRLRLQLAAPEAP